MTIIDDGTYLDEVSCEDDWKGNALALYVWQSEHRACHIEVPT